VGKSREKNRWHLVLKNCSGITQLIQLEDHGMPLKQDLSFRQSSITQPLKTVRSVSRGIQRTGI
jgi:hypothetical protein